jgi:hypothetical protein
VIGVRIQFMAEDPADETPHELYHLIISVEAACAAVLFVDEVGVSAVTHEAPLLTPRAILTCLTVKI